MDIQKNNFQKNGYMYRDIIHTIQEEIDEDDGGRRSHQK